MNDIEARIRRFESDPNWIELPLPVDPGSDRCESVLVERCVDNTFRVVASPGFVEGIAAGDIICRDLDRAEGYRIVKRGSNLSIRFVLGENSSELLDARNELESALSQLGGHLDGTMGKRGLTFTIPVSAGFPAVESVLATAVERFPGSTWWYGNVYDEATGESLDW